MNICNFDGLFEEHSKGKIKWLTSLDKLKESVDFKTSEIEISKRNECYESREEYQDDEIDLKNNYFNFFHEDEKFKKVR